MPKIKYIGNYVKLPVGYLALVFFLIFFGDSYGFFTILNTSNFWGQSFLSRLFVGIAHIASALIAGVLYDRGFHVELIKATAVMFIIANFLIHLSNLYLISLLIYAFAASTYLVIFISIWADISNMKTIGKNLGVGLGAGLLGGFLATGLFFIVNSIEIGILLPVIVFVIVYALSENIRF